MTGSDPSSGGMGNAELWPDDWISTSDDSQTTSSLAEFVEHVYREHSPSLFRYLFRLLRDSGCAEDLVQDVFLRLNRELAAGARIRNPRLWAFRTAHNMAVDWLRRQDHEETWRGQDLPDTSTGSAEADMLARERHRRVRTALSLLTSNERQCLELRAEGFRHREIAELMGVQVSTVGTFVARAIRKMAREIND